MDLYTCFEGMRRDGQFQIIWMSLKRFIKPRMVVAIKGLFLLMGLIYAKTLLILYLKFKFKWLSCANSDKFIPGDVSGSD